MLSRLRVRGFKSIRDQDIEIKALNVLIGNNGAGKSNLVSFFDMIGFLKTGALQRCRPKIHFAQLAPKRQ